MNVSYFFIIEIAFEKALTFSQFIYCGPTTCSLLERFLCSQNMLDNLHFYAHVLIVFNQRYEMLHIRLFFLMKER